MRRSLILARDGLVLLLFAAAAVVFYWPALLGGQVLLPLDNLWTMPPWVGPPGAIPHNRLISDMLLENYPWKLILQQALQQRALPLWNPYEMAGLPYLATGQTSALYPFTLLFLILGPLSAYGWYSALHQFLAASLTYAFLRRLGLGRLGATIGGFVFAYSFFLTVSYIWPMVLGAAVWLPLALWSLTGLAAAAESGKLTRAWSRDLIAGCLAIALSMLGGHLEITFYSTFAVALYALYLGARLWQRSRSGATGRFLVTAGLVVGLGVGIAAVQLVPFLEVLQSNNRQGETTYQQVISYALPKRQVLGLLMPDFFGNPTAHQYFDLTTLRETPVGRNALGQDTDPPHTLFWGTKNYVEAGGYVGVIPLLLAALALWRGLRGKGWSERRRRFGRWWSDRWFFVGLAVLAVLLAFGSPLYALIYYGLPFFSQLRTPFRWLYLLDFALAVLAAFGADDLLGAGRPPSLSPMPRGEGDVGGVRAEAGPGDVPAWTDPGGDDGRKPGTGKLGSPRPRGTEGGAFRFRTAAASGTGTPPPPALPADGEGAGRDGRPSPSPSPGGRGKRLPPAADGGGETILVPGPQPPTPMPRVPLHWLPALLGLVGLVGLGAGFARRDLGLRVAAHFLRTDPELDRAFGSAAMLYSYEFRNLLIFGGLLTFGGVIVGLAGSRWARGPSAQSRGLCLALGGLLLVGVVVDLFALGMPFATKAPAAILDQRMDLSVALPPNLAGPRVVSLGDPEVLPANLGVLLGLPSVTSYDTIISSRFTRLWSLIEPPVDLPYNQIGRLHHVSSLSSPILDLLGVRDVLTESTLNDPAVRLAGQVGPIRIYQRPAALPRAFVVGEAQWAASEDAAFQALAAPGFRPGQVVVLEGTGPGAGGGHGTATIESYQLDQVDVHANVVGNGWLVLADADTPGWQATVDGADTPVLLADGDLRAVSLGPGTHRVVFSYKPLSLRVGAYGSFLALLLLGLVASWPLWRRLIGHYAGQAERVLRNTTLPMATSFLNKAVDFGFAALMLRVIGPEHVGEYTVAIVAVGYFEIVTNFGLNALIIREVSRERSQSGRYLADALALRLGLCALVAPFAAALALLGHSWLGLGSQGVTAFVLLALGLIPSTLTGALSALLNAWERNDVPAVVTVATNLGRVTMGTAALLLGAGIVGLAAISVFLNLVLMAIFVFAVRRALQVRLAGPVPGDLPAMLLESFPLLLNHVLATVFFKIDVLVLQACQSSDAVGYYATAYKWVDGLLIIPSTFTFAVYPALSRFAQQQGEGLRAAYDLSVRLLLAVGIPIAAVITFLAGDLILLLGGPAYYPQSAQALAILIWFLPFSYVNGLTQYALIAVNRQRFLTVAFAIAASFNVVANLMFIPRYSFYAASAITVASEVVLMVPFLIAVHQSIGWPNGPRAAAKLALAGAVMLLLAATLRPVSLPLALLLGLAGYLGAVWALGVFSPAEIAVLRRLVAGLRRKLAPAVEVATG